MIVASVRCISEGLDGSIWFGTNGGGLVRLDNFSQIALWQRYKYPGDIQNDIVTALSCQFVQEGDVWVASYYGASRYIPNSTVKGAGTWQQYTNSDIGAIPGPPSLSTVAVNPIDTKTWFGTYADGLISFDYTDNSWLAVPPPGGVADPQVNAFAFDFSGIIWVAMNSAIGEFDPSHNHWLNIFTAQNTNGLFPVTGANSIATDRTALHYFATTRGVLKLADTTWTILNSSNSPLPSNHVNSLALDLRGNLWIGTDSGCAVYNPSGTQLK
jgi:ligand-binding sensor domain-containing protein